MLNELTLMVKVHNRQYNIPKILKYYSDLPCRRVIIDSSEKKYDNEKLVTSNNFEYFHFNTNKNYFDISIDFLKNCNTKFLIDSPDDDLYLKESIYNSYNFLLANQDYASCSGVTLNVFSNKIGVKYSGATPYGNEIINFGIDKRVFNFFTKTFYPLCHCMVKKDDYYNIFNAISLNKNIKNQINAYDRIFTFMILSSGKHKILDQIFMLRKAGSHRVVNEIRNKKTSWKLNKLEDNLSEEWLSTPFSFYKNSGGKKGFDFVCNTFKQHFSKNKFLTDVEEDSINLQLQKINTMIKGNKDIQNIQEFMWKELKNYND